jgi:hypothetical protein
MGSSIAAGFMSGGINDSTQRLAYPVILAERGDAKKFDIPLLAKRVVRRWIAPITPSAPAAPAARTTCSRPTPTTWPFRTPCGGGLAAPTNAADIYSLLLGGSSEVAAMLAAKPTFATVELGVQRRLRSASQERRPHRGRRQRAHQAGQLPKLLWGRSSRPLASVNSFAAPRCLAVVDPLFGSPILQLARTSFLARDAADGPLPREAW